MASFGNVLRKSSQDDSANAAAPANMYVFIAFIMYSGLYCLECDVDTDGVRTQQGVRRTALTGYLGVDVERQTVECQQVLACIVDAHPLNTNGFEHVLRKRVAQLQGLQAQVSGVPQPEGRHGTGHVARTVARLEHAGHFCVAIALRPPHG